MPIPYHFSDNVLVMEMVTDPEGNPAPRLWDYQPTRQEAHHIHEFIIRQIVVMLCAGVVHGDLSEYNILMSADIRMLYSDRSPCTTPAQSITTICRIMNSWI